MLEIISGSNSVVINKLLSQTSSMARGIFGLQLRMSRGVHFSDNYDQEYEKGVIEIQNASKKEADDLRGFIMWAIAFSGQFSMRSDKSDLGNGVNVAITGCFLDGVSETNQVVSRSGTFNKFGIRIPYIRVL